MGDMADDALESVYENEDARLEYRIGNMDIGEAYDRGIVDELGYEDSPTYTNEQLDYAFDKLTKKRTKPEKKPFEKMCSRCGASGLHWESEGGSWRLFEINGSIHTCKKIECKRSIGITREEIALRFMERWIAAIVNQEYMDEYLDDTSEDGDRCFKEHQRAVAKIAIGYADALIEELEKG